jgi:hypothetical protein
MLAGVRTGNDDRVRNLLEQPVRQPGGVSPHTDNEDGFVASFGELGGKPFLGRTS